MFNRTSGFEPVIFNVLTSFPSLFGQLSTNNEDDPISLQSFQEKISFP